jgi:predicted MPP superfamily phosphohydrolase
MKSNLKILHISDLHVPNGFIEDSDFNTFKDNFLKDISNPKENHSNIDHENIDIVIFTGDLIDKGNINTLKVQEFKKYIEQIVNNAGAKIENVIFVPGNHDCQRPKPNSMIDNHIKIVRADGEVTKINEDFNYLCKRFDAFTDFMMEFNNKTNEEDILSYGVNDILIDNMKYRFIRINSAIGSRDNKDYSNLFITKIQLDKIDNLIRQKSAEKKPDLTFLVMHHPAEWLCYKEQRMLHQYVTSRYHVDVILCSHTHSGEISLNTDLDNNVIRLVSGIGYNNDSNSHHSGDCPHNRYAIYDIDIRKNTLKGYLRKSFDSFIFKQDISMYKGINRDGVFTIPLKIDYDILIKEIPNYADEGVAINSKIFEEIQNALKACSKFNTQIRETLPNSCIVENKDATKTFQTALLNLCATFKSVVFSRSIINKGITFIVRYYYEENNKKYHKVLLAYDDEITILSPETEEVVIQDLNKKFKVSYELIDKESNFVMKAYKDGKSVIKTKNREQNDGSNEGWNDSIILSSKFFSNKNDIIVPECFPDLSFEIFFKTGNQTTERDMIMQKLFALRFINFENMIINLIKEIIERTGVDLEKLSRKGVKSNGN